MIALLAACAAPPAPVLPPSEPAPSGPARDRPSSPQALADLVAGLGGLQCTDRVVGTGAEARDGSVVVVDFVGWADDGTVWDSTWDRPDPYRVELGSGRLVEGLDRGIAGMRVGGVREIVIPPELGFGEWSLPDRFPEDAVLTVDVDLIDVFDPPRGSARPDRTEARGPFAVADLVEGSGREVEDDSTVIADWVVFGPDGVLESSWTRAAPYELPVAAARLGPALVGMRAGGRRAILADRGSDLQGAGLQPALPSDEAIQVQVDVHRVE